MTGTTNLLRGNGIIRTINRSLTRPERNRGALDADQGTNSGALQPLKDQESGKSLIDLQLIRDIMVKEDRISLSIVCLEEEDASRMELEQKVRDLLTESGVENIHIRLRNATDYERSILRTEGSPDKPEQEEGTALKGMQQALRTMSCWMRTPA